MTKTQLFMAASVAAITLAGPALAGPIVATDPVFAGASSTATAGAVRLADELRFSATSSTASGFAGTRGTVVYNFLPTVAGAFPTGESLLLTVDVSGAVMTGPASVSATSTDTSCTISVSPADAGEANDTSATFFVQFAAACNDAQTDGLSITLPFQVTGANDVFTGARLQRSFGGSLVDIDGGRSAAQLIDSVSAFDVEVSSNENVAIADVSEGYEDFTFSPVDVANVAIQVDSSVRTTISTTSGSSATTTSIANVRLQATAVTGSFEGYNLTGSLDSGSTTSRFSATSASATAATIRQLTISGASLDGDNNVQVSVVDNTATATGSGVSAADLNGRIDETSITLSATVDLVTDNAFGTSTGQFVDFSETSNTFTIVDRNGASFVAPWFALQSAGANSTLRISNNSQTEDTGLIRVRLLSDNGTGTPAVREITITPADIQAGVLSADNGIPAQRTVSINGNTLAARFGSDARNGDIEVSVEAQSNQISGKVRVTQPNGNIFESTLGEIEADHLK